MTKSRKISKKTVIDLIRSVEADVAYDPFEWVYPNTFVVHGKKSETMDTVLYGIDGSDFGNYEYAIAAYNSCWMPDTRVAYAIKRNGVWYTDIEGVHVYTSYMQHVNEYQAEFGDYPEVAVDNVDNYYSNSFHMNELTFTNGSGSTFTHHNVRKYNKGVVIYDDTLIGSETFGFSITPDHEIVK